MKKSAIMIIAGSDSIAGAGVQRDIKTCCTIGVLATNVITCVTAQNSLGVQAIQDVKIDVINHQILSIQDEYDISHVKIGMLHNYEIIDAVYNFAVKNPEIKLIFDPVMIATSGGVLLQKSALEYMKKLTGKSFIITPNIDEAEVLSDMKISIKKDITLAARKIFNLGTMFVLIKGGHFDIGNDIITNILFDGESFHEFSSKRVKNQDFHGTGCMLSSAIAAYLARKFDTFSSIKNALNFTENAIENWKIGNII